MIAFFRQGYECAAAFFRQWLLDAMCTRIHNMHTHGRHTQLFHVRLMMMRLLMMMPFPGRMMVSHTCLARHNMIIITLLDFFWSRFDCVVSLASNPLLQSVPCDLSVGLPHQGLVMNVHLRKLCIEPSLFFRKNIIWISLPCSGILHICACRCHEQSMYVLTPHRLC